MGLLGPPGACVVWNCQGPAAWHLGLPGLGTTEAHHLSEGSCAPLRPLMPGLLGARASTVLPTPACLLHGGGVLSHFETANPLATLIPGPSPL